MRRQCQSRIYFKLTTTATNIPLRLSWNTNKCKKQTYPWPRQLDHVVVYSWTNCSLASWSDQWPRLARAFHAATDTGCASTSRARRCATSPWSSRTSPRRPRWCAATETFVARDTCPLRLTGGLWCSRPRDSAQLARVVAVSGATMARTSCSREACRGRGNGAGDRQHGIWPNISNQNQKEHIRIRARNEKRRQTTKWNASLPWV